MRTKTPSMASVMRTLRAKQLLASMLLLMTIFDAQAHVSLTFPPSRYPSLDFLDNSRTAPPCGVQKPPIGQGRYTSFKAGSKFNVTWHQGYVHQGGFRLELLNEKDETVLILTPPELYTGSNDVTAQSFEVQLPANLECENCGLRLLRQAEEWKDYIFWSCADISISKTYVEKCSGNGQLKDGQCKCNKLYSGPSCQNKDECWDDTDCGPHGICKDLQSFSFPRKLCFCQIGFYGPVCNKVSSLSKKEFNPNLYQLRTIGKGGKIYWRIVADTNEIEFILQYPTLSWAAVGWRPNQLSPQCQSIPLSQSRLQNGADFESTEARPPVFGVGSTSEILPGREPALRAPVPSRALEIAASSRATIAQTGLTTEDLPEYDNGDIESPAAGSEEDLVPQIITDPRQISSDLASAIFNNKSMTHGSALLQSTSNQKINSTIPAAIFITPSSATFGPPETDLQTFISRSNQTGQILIPNFQEPPTHTPPSPFRALPNLEQSIDEEPVPRQQNSVGGQFGRDGATAPTQGRNISKLPFLSGTRIVGPIDVASLPSTGGTSSENRAVIEVPIDQENHKLVSLIQPPSVTEVPEVRHTADGISEVEGDVCFGEWRWPPDCADGQAPPAGRLSCDYRASWSLRDDSDDIEFSIETRSPNNWWTGIGFSKSGTMFDADMVIIESAAGGEVRIKDMHSTGYTAPTLDPIQNIQSQGASHVNGMIRVGFTRPRSTGDADHDVAFTNDDCFYLLFPVGGGRIVNGQMSKHADRPKNSTKPVCIKPCPTTKLSPTSCQRDFKFPPGCVPPTCDYTANWKYNERTEDVSFEITSKGVGRWTGIGFSRDGNMTNSDMVVGWMYADEPYVTDRYAYGKHQPAIDSLQNIDGVTGRQFEDQQMISFRRKLVTNDIREDLSLLDCQYFLFPIGGGRILARSQKEFAEKATAIGYHDLYVPRVTKEPICICTDNGEFIQVSKRRHRRQAAAVRDHVIPLPGATDQPELASDVPTIPTGGLGRGTPQFEETSIDEPTLFNGPVFNVGNLPAPVNGSRTLGIITPAGGSIGSSSETLVQGGSLIHSLPDQPALAPGFRPQIVARGPGAAEFPEEAEPLPTTAPAVVNPFSGGQFSIKITKEGSNRTVTAPQAVSIPVPEPTGTSRTEPVPISSADGDYEEEESGDGPIPEAEFNGGSKGADSLSNAMDCTDIVVGSAIGSVSRIGDYYTVSRATPRVDSFYGGRDSLTAAMGFEENGITTIMFRKALRSDDAADHSITNKPMTMIWAQGQQASFYEPDVLKYHGPENRGFMEVNFFDRPKNSSKQCQGEFTFPVGCAGLACQYNATWYRNYTDVVFIITTRTKTNTWAGIGYSAKGTMASADMVIAKINPGSTVEVHDRYSRGYASPEIDREQNIYNPHANYSDGVLTLQFSRALVTPDTSTDISLDACQYFLFPVTGGVLNPDGSLSKHSRTPYLSADPVCLGQCVNPKPQSNQVSPVAEPIPSPETPKVPPHEEAITPSVFYIHMYLPDLKWSEELRDENSAKFKELNSLLVPELSNQLALKLNGFKSLRTVQFTNGTVHAHLELTAEGHTAQEVQAALSQVLQSDNYKISGIRVDSQSLQVQKQEIVGNAELLRNYIIIGVCCFLVLATIILAICLAVRSRKRKSKELNSMAAPYSSAPYMSPYNRYPAMMGQMPDAKPLAAQPSIQTTPSTPGSTNEGYAYNAEVYHNAKIGTQTARSREHIADSNAYQNGKKTSPQSATHRRSSSSPPPNSPHGSANNGGQTTLNDWWNQRLQESERSRELAGQRLPPQGQAGPPVHHDHRLPPQAHGIIPYVTYPNDPYTYYTMNGHNRAFGPMRPIAPPGYYRPY